ncbi:adenosylcobinamide-GDP ribazoletransferase [Romeria aff. gracilis LEGE 07310]|uniref:Adenosylcobinamide-GDP ribazoletransferase n=1 Tax=Vasconcelosia minhoensis LEGE 07310 TaxID=915328 RepID=A0A8J7AIM5_9CYAN|nr:adenosylcobinamide-GDP ribazoletransferase [Romeria gracilis]MBE9076095.1 adenosylcobinamide-GDP ribazoletransferase [Romeria aff. gracilis LEGE 07310]
MPNRLAIALSHWNGALMFYTCLPLPASWPVAFERTAQFAPLVGVVLALGLGLADGLLGLLHMPLLVRSALIVMGWLALTGGLHLDGVMDTADGLAVPPQRRLAVMADSHMGAFGGMAAIALLLLKVTALASLPQYRAFALMVAAGWGRWGQQWAIARYDYLRPEGKGAFHQKAIRSGRDTLPSGLGLLGLTGLLGLLGWVSWLPIGLSLIGGWGGSMILAAYFDRKLGGHTGDTYGAVVEWTEALVFCCLTIGTSV